jgi:hypothetical protein
VTFQSSLAFAAPITEAKGQGGFTPACGSAERLRAVPDGAANCQPPGAADRPWQPIDSPAEVYGDSSCQALIMEAWSRRFPGSQRNPRGP